MIVVDRLAPTSETALDYDCEHLALYAALLDADDTGQDWQDAAATLLQIDPADPYAEDCWRSHVERARWIIGEGLAVAVMAFGVTPGQTD